MGMPVVLEYGVHESNGLTPGTALCSSQVWCMFEAEVSEIYVADCMYTAVCSFMLVTCRPAGPFIKVQLLIEFHC